MTSSGAASVPSGLGRYAARVRGARECVPEEFVADGLAEFAAPGLLPQAQLRLPGGGVVWMYRMPEKAD